MNPIVTVCALTKKYGPNPVLRGVDLAVEHGEWVALMGPSGCGKSTLLNLIGGLDQPDSGTITLADHRVDVLAANKRAELRRAHVGIVFQAFNLVPHLDVQQNVELPLRLAGVNRRAATRRSLSLLERLGLEGHAHAAPSTLSGGQQQRVAIARALANQPTVLLTDEPTGSLDTEATNVVLDLLRDEHRNGQTVVMVTHDYRVASASDRIVRMRDGRCDLSESMHEESYTDDLIGATTESPFDRLVRFE